jgi:hypothetical protein
MDGGDDGNVNLKTLLKGRNFQPKVWKKAYIFDFRRIKKTVASVFRPHNLSFSRMEGMLSIKIIHQH